VPISRTRTVWTLRGSKSGDCPGAATRFDIQPP
jgi:hypothetical protein